MIIDKVPKRFIVEKAVADGTLFSIDYCACRTCCKGDNLRNLYTATLRCVKCNRID